MTSIAIIILLVHVYPSAVPTVQSTIVPSNLNDTSDGLDVCERVTLLIIIVSAACGALLSLVLVLLLCCIVALTRKRVRQRNVRLAGRVRHIAPYPARRVALSSMFHLHSNVCYATNPLLVRNGDIGVSSQQFSPCNVSLNPSCSTPASPNTDSKPPTHQYDDVILNAPQNDEDPTEMYDKLQPKEKEPSYENTTGRLFQHQIQNIHASCFSSSQAATNTLLPPITFTCPQATAQDGLSTLSEEDYVNEFNGPFSNLSDLSMTRISRPPPASLCVNLKRHCTTYSTQHSSTVQDGLSTLSGGDYVNEFDGPLTAIPTSQIRHCITSSTQPFHLSRPHRPRDYEVPEPSRRLKRNLTL